MILLADLLDATADTVRSTPEPDLPLWGRVWTLRITDTSVIVEIERAGINGEPQPRRPKDPPPKDPPPKDPPPKDPPPKDPPPKKDRS